MFTHLHTHTEFSLLDGLAKIDALMARASALGQEALAITDHGNLHGAVDFYTAAKSAGLHPILGLEAYIAGGDMHDRDARARADYHHLTLLAASQRGWRNLVTLATQAHLEGFYYRPRIDHDRLAAHSEGLIALSGCPSGELHKALAERRDADARRIVAWHRDTFGDRYYLEIQNHHDPKFTRLLPALVELSRTSGVPLVATHDAHYVAPEDTISHEVLLCIGTATTMQQKDRFRLDGDDFYLTSEAEMRQRFPDLPEAIDITNTIAARCQVDLEFGRLQLPQPDLPPGTSAIDHLTDLASRGLEQRYGRPTPAQIERLTSELAVVRETGFAEYFLIVRDFSHFARAQHIAMGVRGSAAGSIILYCLEITDIDPLQHGLVFERFLNVERHEMPDIDMDFADDRRDEVIRYVADKYGHDRVAQIITFGTLGAKAAIRDTGRALGLAYPEVDRVARLIPTQLNITLDDALEQRRDLRELYDQDAEIRALIDQARKLEGVVRNAATHAAAVVIARDPLIENVPLQRPPRGDEHSIPMTQWAMTQCAAIGLLKMDFLGLTNLTILDTAVALIEELSDERIDYLHLPDGDPETCALLARGETFGVFQMESSGMRRYVQQLRPTGQADLAAMVALYRPGPMEHIPRYIRAKHGQEPSRYPHPDLAEILDETYGVIVYQDQVLQIAQKFAGYTLGQADIMRKAMGKKIPAVMEAERGRFIAGAQRLGYREADATTVFDLIEPFAGYAFNKAHAVCYGSIAYQTAYLKAHQPIPYLTAVLRAASDNTDRIGLAAADCARLQLPLLPPHINRSQATFTPEPLADGRLAIRFGLANVKNVGHAAVDGLITEREEHGDFTSLEDLCRRADPRALNKRALESLIKAGTLDGLAAHGPALAGIDRIMRLAHREQELKASGQTTMFDLFGQQVDTPRPELGLDELAEADVTRGEQLQWEKELLGTYVSEHPFQRAAAALERHITTHAAEISDELAGQEIVLAGTVTLVRPLTTRRGEPFCAVEIEDLSGSVEVTVWPDLFAATRSSWEDGQVLLIHARVRSRGDRLTVAVQHVTPYQEAPDGSGGRLAEDPTLWGVRETGARPGPRRDHGHPAPPTAAAASAPPAAAPPPRSPRHIREHAPPPAPPITGNGAGLTLRVRLHESDDTAADQRRLQDVIRTVKATPGPHHAFLILDGGRERVTLALPECTASAAVVAELNGLLGEHGDAEIEPVPLDAAG